MEIFKNHKIISFVTILASIATLFSFGSQLAFGNPSSFPVHSSCATAPATTTLNWLTAGTGTTTITCDAYSTDPLAPSPSSIDAGALQLIVAASSSPLTDLRFRVEHSSDNINWFAEAQGLSSSATTTPTEGTFAENRLALATSSPLAGTSQTVGFGTGNGLGSTTAVFLNFPLSNFSTRYTRVVLYLQPGNGLSTSTNVGLWGEIVPRKQVR